MPIKNEIYWHTLKQPVKQGLSSDDSCDFAVIGGGMAGLSAAQRLAETGKKVIVLERDFCGSGASGRSSGFITPDSELELSTLVENFGASQAKKLWGFVSSGVNHIKNTIEENKIDCDYQIQDSLFIANSPRKFKTRVIREHEARINLGYHSRLYDQGQLSEILGSQNYYGAVRYPETFGINSYLYCQNLKNVLISKGVEVYESSQVSRIEKNTVFANGFKLTAEKIIVCTDRFLPRLGVLKPHVYQVQTFLGLSKPLTEQTVKQIFPQTKMMVWDTDLIYQYYRVVSDNRLLIGAASVFYTYLPFSVAHPKNVERAMKNYLRLKFPDLRVELDYFWPGLIGVSKDFVPLAGQDKTNPKMYYVGAATGLPWAAALGGYIADKIINGRNDFDREFNPERKYPIGRYIQGIISKPVTFALSHGIIKYLS